MKTFLSRPGLRTVCDHPPENWGRQEQATAFPNWHITPK
jgi:hypothetical protein